MPFDIAVQFIGELLRTILIEELSAHVRSKAEKARFLKRNRFNLMLKAGRPNRGIRKLSTMGCTKVK